MLKTEAEKKWCPYARAPSAEVKEKGSGSFTQGESSGDGSIAFVGANRATAKAKCKCISDKCMAWVSHEGGASGFCVLADDNNQR